MMRKMDALFIKSQMKWHNFCEDFKSDERGLSGVVVAVLLIVIAVIIIAALYLALNGLLEEWWTRITKGSSDVMNTDPNFETP